MRMLRETGEEDGILGEGILIKPGLLSRSGILNKLSL